MQYSVMKILPSDLPRSWTLTATSVTGLGPGTSLSWMMNLYPSGEVRTTLEGPVACFELSCPFLHNRLCVRYADLSCLSQSCNVWCIPYLASCLECRSWFDCNTVEFIAHVVRFDFVVVCKLEDKTGAFFRITNHGLAPTSIVRSIAGSFTTFIKLNYTSQCIGWASRQVFKIHPPNELAHGTWPLPQLLTSSWRRTCMPRYPLKNSMADLLSLILKTQWRLRHGEGLLTADMLKFNLVLCFGLVEYPDLNTPAEIISLIELKLQYL